MLFVLDKEGKAALKPVQVGDWLGSDWMVLGGLAAGDRVIIDNLLKLRPGTQVNPVAPGSATPSAPGAGKPATSGADKSAAIGANKSAAPGAPAK